MTADNEETAPSEDVVITACMHLLVENTEKIDEIEAKLELLAAGLRALATVVKDHLEKREGENRG